MISGWISFGSQYATAAGLIKPHKLPVSVDGCENPNIEFNSTLIYPDESDVFPLYRLSYHWIAPAGVCAVLLVGAIASIPGRHKQLRDVDPDQLSPVVAWMVKKHLKHSETDISALDLKVSILLKLVKRITIHIIYFRKLEEQHFPNFDQIYRIFIILQIVKTCTYICIFK